MLSQNGDLQGHTGPNVTRFRIRKGLTRAQLAEAADVSQRTLSNVERGNNVTMERLMAIADGLPLDLATLMFDGFDCADGVVHVVRVNTVDAKGLGPQLVRALSETSALASTRLAYLTCRAGHSFRADAAPAGVLYLLHVLQGTVNFGPLDHPVDLHAGDLATMRGDQAYVLGSESANASALMVTTLQE